MKRPLLRIGLAAVVCAIFALVAPRALEARPGGGSSFKSSSSGSSRSSSGSSSRSSSNSGSRSSSNSGSRSSSDSGSRTSGGSRSTPDAWFVRASSGRDRTAERALWAPGGASVYGAAAPRPAAWPPPNEVTGGIIGGFLFVLSSLFIGFVALVIHVVGRLRRRKLGDGWSTTSVAAQPRAELDVIRQTDPDFSIAIFEDFLYALYAEAHMARGAGTLERLSPWLAPPARQALAQRGGVRVDSVIVGAMRFVSLATHDPLRYEVTVSVEANYGETLPDGRQRALWVEELWTIARAKSARSRPPQRARIFDCPSCGGALDRMIGGTCRYCNRAVDGGDFDWVVRAITLQGSEERGPMLTGTTEEQGNDLATIVDPQLQARLAALQAKDPAFSAPAFQARVGLIFATMQHAWSSLSWHLARPFLSDNLYQSQTYWIDAYRRAGLRNVTERPRIVRIDLARVTSDRWFDAITVRVFATSLDFTLRDADGAVVGGSRERERAYTEYWTLLRGVSAQGPARTEAVCPRCGAPLAVNMAGLCNACGAKVSSGEFDWVLAKIEQDDVYAG